MKKDIIVKAVENVFVAAVFEDNNWNIYLLNSKDTELNTVIVNSKGYGVLGDKEVKTSTLRFVFDKVKDNYANLIEPIDEQVFGLTNEYWVSFFEDGVMLDKKFIFEANSINKENLVNLSMINKKGILAK